MGLPLRADLDFLAYLFCCVCVVCVCVCSVVCRLCGVSCEESVRCRVRCGVPCPIKRGGFTPSHVIYTHMCAVWASARCACGQSQL